MSFDNSEDRSAKNETKPEVLNTKKRLSIEINDEEKTFTKDFKEIPKSSQNKMEVNM